MCAIELNSDEWLSQCEGLMLTFDVSKTGFSNLANSIFVSY